jgi:excisionase family DNA binding protein
MPKSAYSASQAARLAGVSIPTLKLMCDAGEISYFRTPGGHLRIPADAVERLLGHAVAPTASETTTGLQGHRRRERELGSKSQERVARSRAQQVENEGKLTNQASWRQLQGETDLQATRLASERARGQAAQKRSIADARYRHDMFHRRWRGAAADLLPFWLSFEQHEMAIEALDRVITRCSEEDEWRMSQVLSEAIARLLAPWEKARQMATRREQIHESALRNLSVWASASERTRAIAAIREALAGLPSTALDYEERAIAEQAVGGVNEKVKTRLALQEKERAEKEDQARKAREDQQRTLRKDDLVRRGVDEVWLCLWSLKNGGVISEEEYQDIDQDSLKRAVGRLVQSKITGNETDRDLATVVEQIVLDELELESEDEFDEEA